MSRKTGLLSAGERCTVPGRLQYYEEKKSRVKRNPLDLVTFHKAPLADDGGHTPITVFAFSFRFKPL